jgi:tRNA-2-methylthio-N6-dimethylallyladenosine synthase
MVAAVTEGVRTTRTELDPSPERFDLPQRHPACPDPSPGRAWLTVMEGCDMFCSFCIVPITRGREISRPSSDILSEASELAERGVREITLLGQTVNAYGRHSRRRTKGDGSAELSFAGLLRRLDEIPGIERIRYTSPHPLFFAADLIRAHAELESLCPHVHLPLQSGSDSVLRRMRRRYTSEQFLRIVDALRAARPDIAITSDLIVGFPGESEADFDATLRLVERARLTDSFNFKYSARPGTAAAEFADAIPAEEAQQRLVVLQSLQRRLTVGYHRSRVGSRAEILVEGASRRGSGQASGRDAHHRVVNVDLPPGSDPTRGEMWPVEIVDFTPHSLIAQRISSIPTTALKARDRAADETGRIAVPADSGARPL